LANTFKRSARISDLIIKEVSQMIIKGEIRDPRVGAAFITGARVSDNLSDANIFFSVIDGAADKEEVLKGLESARGFIKTALAKRLKMRKLPDIHFQYDNALETGYKVDEVLRGINSEE
jgi:ribosome-binding factor A